ncbi:hypothetical protein IT413_03015 [Candidatus Peregrinibacteria bacterium]|nr:hypothetical protein [Candidatus Peregrinibacteria bacterium]
MAGEFFQSERGQIKAVEAQAQKEKKEKVVTELQAKKDLFHTEVGKAGKLLADAESKVTLQASKDKVSGYKKDISSTLKEIVNQGQSALKRENPDADLAVIDLLAGSLKSTLATVKQYVPLFNDVESGKTHLPKIETELKKAREAKKKSGVGSPEFNTAYDAAEQALGSAQESEIYLWKVEALPAEMQAILMSVLGPLKDQEAEIAGYRLERTQDSALNDNADDNVETKADKVNMRILKPAKAAFDAVQPTMEKISGAVKDSKEKPEKLTEISGSVDTAMTDLGNVLKQLNSIDKAKFVDPMYLTLYENTLSKVNLQLSDLASLKVAIKTRELMTTGLTEEEKKYVTMDEKGNIQKTAEFKKLPKDKQMALEAKFKLIEMEVSMELDEKTAGEKEKKMIEGRKKLMAGDPFGAKEDLLSYYNQEAKNAERDPVRFEQAKEMLKQIAKMELSQMVQRLAAMKASIKERYNNKIIPGEKTDFGTHTYDQAYDNIENMARVIDAAEEMIESGKCVTIEGAEALLRKFEFPPNSVQSVQAMDEKVAGIKEKGNDELQKGKEERIKREKDEVTRLERSIQQLESGEIQATLDGQPITTEYIEKRKEQLKLQREKVTKVEGMSLEDERQAQLVPAERELKKAKLDRALKSWKLGFPVDMNSNSWEVFDMFVQQRKLNDADPEKRKQATLEEAQKARDRGLTGLSRQLYESYFAKQLQEGAKLVDKAKVREKTLNNGDVKKRLEEGITKWKEEYKKQWGRDAEDAEIQEARGKMQNMVVSEAYNKEVKLSTYSMLEGASGPEAEEWRKVYGGTVAIENFGQGGVLTAFWTDEEWNALPVKVGVFTAVTIASAGVGSAAVAGTGMAARAVLGEAIIGRVLATGSGRALAWAGGAAVEGAAFSAAQYEFNNMLMGNGYERFSAEYWKAMGHSVATMGILKGVGTGVGKLRNLAEAGKAPSFIEGGMGAMAKDAAWWLGKTSLEGGAMVGLDAGMAFLSGRHFTGKEAMKSFGENFLFSATVGGVHSFMGHGAHEGPTEKKMVEEISTAEAIGKYSKAKVEIDIAQSKLNKAKAEGLPTEKLEADLVAKKKAAEGAEVKVAEAEKVEGEAHKSNIEKRKTDLEAKIAEQQKEGKIDPNLVAQLKIAEAILGSLGGSEGADKGPYRSPGGVKIDVETLGIFEKYTTALLGHDATELASLRSRYPQHAELFGIIEKQANSVNTPRDAVVLLIAGEVGSAVAGKKLNTPAEIAEYVDKYNANNKPVAEGEPQIVAVLGEGRGVLIIDKNGKLQYMEKTAAETHFYSVFSKGIPEEMLGEEGVDGKKKESKDVPAWIDKEGKIHYNSEYFEAKYGVEMKQVEGKDGKPVNVFVVDGVEMSAKEFFKSHPQGKEILAEMKTEGKHERAHRVIGAAKIGEKLVKLVQADPQLSELFARRGQELTPRNAEEFMAEIADGRVQGLAPITRILLETSISADIPGFTFDKVAQVDTMKLKFTSPEDLVRSTADAFHVRDPALDSSAHQQAYADYTFLMKQRPDLQGNNAEIRKILGDKAYQLLSEYHVAKQLYDRSAVVEAASLAIGKQLQDAVYKVDPKDRQAFEALRDRLFAALGRGEFADAVQIVGKHPIYQKYKSYFDLMEKFQATKDQQRALDMISGLGGPPAMKQKLIKNAHLLTPDKVEVLKRFASDSQDVDTILNHPDPKLMKLLSRDVNGHLENYVDIILNSPSTFSASISPEKQKFLERSLDSQNITQDIVEKVMATNQISAPMFEFLGKNINSPYMNKDMVDRMASGKSEKIDINGVSYEYYPDMSKSAGEGGIGAFYRVALIDPVTKEVRFAGMKVVKPDAAAQGITLGSEAVGAGYVVDVVQKEKANGADNVFVKPIAISPDGKSILYELVDYTGADGKKKSGDYDALGDDPNVPLSRLLHGLHDGAIGLSFLHRNGLIHGDFKSSQIFPTDNGGRLGDFGTVTPNDAFFQGLSGHIPGYTFNGSTEPVYLGRVPSQVSPMFYSGAVTDAVIAKGPQYAWKIDAYALGVQLEAIVTGKIHMPKAAPDHKYDPTSSVPMDYGIDRSPADPVAKAKLMEIVNKLKDPNNFTYTPADAARDMKPYIQ